MDPDPGDPKTCGLGFETVSPTLLEIFTVVLKILRADDIRDDGNGHPVQPAGGQAG
jgi:hypothetical protein